MQKSVFIRRYLSLDDTDLLIHVCVHGLAWNQIPPIRWLVDAMLVLRTGKIDWDTLVSFAERSHLSLPLTLGLTYLQKLLNAPIPTEALQKLQQIPVSLPQRFYYWGRNQSHRLFRFPVNAFGLYYSLYRAYCQAGKTSNTEEQSLSFLQYLQQIWHLDRSDRVFFYGCTRLISQLKNS